MSVLKHRPILPIWFALLGAGMLTGLLGVGAVLLHGHAEVYNVTSEIPWGMLIATYIFLVVSSTGLCLASTLGHVFGIEHFEFIGKRAILLAILTLVCGFGAIAMELNHPIRMALYAVISPNFTSAIWWMDAFYGLYLVLLCGEFYFLMKRMKRGAFAMGMLGIIAAVSAHSNLGAAFGLHGSFLLIYFIFSALVSGGAIVSLIVYFNHKESSTPMPRGTIGKLRALFLTVLIFFVIWKTVPGIYGLPQEKYETTMAVLSGPPSSLIEVAIVVGAISTCLFLYTMAEKFLLLESEH
jgi:molybdopterin-containing oxidoreductase family membrane subunit